VKAFKCRLRRTSPAVCSERPYIGDESITLPPPAKSAWTTSRSGASSAVSNVRHVPMPTTGSSSPVLGMERLSIAG
jgi:hypothetical protein